MEPQEKAVLCNFSFHYDVLPFVFIQVTMSSVFLSRWLDDVASAYPQKIQFQTVSVWSAFLIPFTQFSILFYHCSTQQKYLSLHRILVIHNLAHPGSQSVSKLTIHFVVSSGLICHFCVLQVLDQELASCSLHISSSQQATWTAPCMCCGAIRTLFSFNAFISKMRELQGVP
jgi:hypothetical protein